MRLLDYINGEPRGYFLPDMGTNGLFLTGYTAYEVYEDPRKQLELARVMDETFPADFVYTLCDGAIFCDTLGLDLIRPYKDFPSVLSHPIKNAEDLRQYSVPHPHRDGRMPLNLESFKLISADFDKPLFVSIQGPFTLAVQLVGATDLLRAIVKDSEFVVEVLEFTTETVLRYTVATQEAGARYISIAEPATVTLGRERFRTLVVPSLNRIYDELSCWRALHICGDTTAFLDLMLSCHIDAISLDQIMDYEKVIARIPEHIVLLGNLDPLELLRNSPPDEIRTRTLELLDKMAAYSNYLCAFGCNCMNDTPVENLQAALSAGRSPDATVQAKSGRGDGAH